MLIRSGISYMHLDSGFVGSRWSRNLLFSSIEWLLEKKKNHISQHNKHNINAPTCMGSLILYHHSRPSKWMLNPNQLLCISWYLCPVVLQASIKLQKVDTGSVLKRTTTRSKSISGVQFAGSLKLAGAADCQDRHRLFPALERQLH